MTNGDATITNDMAVGGWS